MFADKTVVITGASSGLGRQLARDCAARRANCVLFARNTAALEEVAVECQAAGGRVLVVTGDVTVPDDCERLAKEAEEKFGGIDVYISNAGLSMWSPFEDITDVGIFRKLMEVNYLGAVHGAYATLPALKASGGRFVAIASIQSRMGVPCHTGYVASKHALEGFCKALRYDLEGSGVTVLTVHPHWMRGTNLRANACAADGGTVGEKRRSHGSESVTVEQCAEAVLAAIENRDEELVIPPKLRLVPWLNLFWPGYLRRKVWRLVGRQK